MDHLGASLELKTVDVRQRIISGYAAIHGTVDKVRDIIEPVASVKAIGQLKQFSDVAVFIGHDSHALPAGTPIKIEATPKGLYTETYIWKGSAGDNLLDIAKDMQDHGQALGMSIGYQTQESKPDRHQGKMIRRIGAYALKEYSYAAPQVIAHPDALSLSVKALSEGTDSAGGALVPSDDKTGSGTDYRVERQGDEWVVLADTDSDGDADDNQVIGRYPSQDMANAVTLALRRAAGISESDDDAAKVGGTVDEQKADLSSADENDLPDSSFLYVESGGQKDGSGKTVPRDKRHLPYKTASGAIDLPHVRNALSRLDQSATLPGLDESTKKNLVARLQMMLKKEGGDDSDKTLDAESDEWKIGAPIQLWHLGVRLQDIARRLTTEHKAMRLLGENTKDNCRMRPEIRRDLEALSKEFKGVMDWTATIERGEDDQAMVALYRAKLQVLEV